MPAKRASECNRNLDDRAHVGGSMNSGKVDCQDTIGDIVNRSFLFACDIE